MWQPISIVALLVFLGNFSTSRRNRIEKDEKKITEFCETNDLRYARSCLVVVWAWKSCRRLTLGAVAVLKSLNDCREALDLYPRCSAFLHVDEENNRFVFRTAKFAMLVMLALAGAILALHLPWAAKKDVLARGMTLAQANTVGALAFAAGALVAVGLIAFAVLLFLDIRRLVRITQS